MKTKSPGNKISFKTKFENFIGNNLIKFLFGLIGFIIISMIYNSIQTYYYYSDYKQNEQIAKQEIFLKESYKPFLDSNSIEKLDSIEKIYKDSLNCDCPDYKENELYKKIKELDRIEKL